MLTGLPPGAAFEIETLDRAHGFAFRKWQEMGNPEPPTREQTAQLRQASLNTRRDTVRDEATGKLTQAFKLQPWDVVSVRQL